MTLYRLYQLIGGNEDWVHVQDSINLAPIKPTFITVLSCDTLLYKNSARELTDNAKYLGPMYFDLDSKDISDSIEGAKSLWRKLSVDYGLVEGDVDFYLSGKKGLHFLIPPKVFMEKAAPAHKLPAIYKEMAFNLAVDTLDFAVYSGGMGRMFRTTYNQRENGKYKVQITLEELLSLTPETYDAISASQRPVLELVSTFKPKFAILFESIRQKVSSTKRKPYKPVDAATLRRHLPTLQKLMRGESVRDGVGFNKIAIQLAIYAREAKLTEDQLVQHCAGLLQHHNSDSYRYNSAYKREAELRRMFCYLEENTSYDYSIGPIQAMLEPDVDEDGDPIEVEADTEAEDSGVFVKNGGYYVASEQGEKRILDAKFKDVTVLLLTESEQISCILSKIQVGEKVSVASLERSDFLSSSALHKVVSLFGASFTGNDVHARHIYTHMLKESKIAGKTVYATEKEGLDLLFMPQSDIEEARKPFVVWADANGVILPKSLVDQGLDVRFVGYPSPEGLMRTDLAKAPSFAAWAAEEGNKAKLLELVRGMLGCQSASAMSKMIGWMTSCFYSQLFRRVYGKFPLMHINGVAGSGKTETVAGLMHMFYYRADPVTLTAASTRFSLEAAIASSASIPVIIDEYKPQTLNAVKLGELKSMFRSSYNSQLVSRGGGNRQKDSFSAINSTRLTGPVMFIAEAIEQESAILERCVVVTLQRPSGRLYPRYAPRFAMFKFHQEILGILGQYIAGDVITSITPESLKEKFDPIHAVVQKKYLPSLPTATPVVVEEESSDTQVTKDLKWFSRPRTVYNHAVAEFGILQFRDMIFRMLPEHIEEFTPTFKALAEECYTGMDDIAKQSLPEYVKVLLAISDMTRFPGQDADRIVHDVDFELGNLGGTETIALVGRMVFTKYRQFCKRVGEQPLFPAEGSFLHSLRCSDLFIKLGVGTKRVAQETILLDYIALQRLGCPPFTK